MRNVIVTGGAKGIGEAVCRAFAKNGDRVFICYNRSKEKALRLQDELEREGKQALAVHLDVTDKAQIKQFADVLLRDFGGADVLVNNAGICQESFFADLSDRDVENMVTTNLTSVLLVTKALLPHMLTRKKGAVISISSIWGEVGGSCEAHYSAAKAGIIGFTRALSKEVGPSGITVNTVSPGCIMTDMMSDYTVEDIELIKEQTPLGTIGTPEDVANAVLFLADEKSRFITGISLPVDGGFGR